MGLSRNPPKVCPDPAAAQAVKYGTQINQEHQEGDAIGHSDIQEQPGSGLPAYPGYYTTSLQACQARHMARPLPFLSSASIIKTR